MPNKILGLLQAVAVPAVVVGAVGSVGLMLRGGHPPLFLRIIFVIWVSAPFIALLLANMVSNRWSLITRATLHSVMVVLALSSLGIYGYAILRPPKSTPAFPFVMVPVCSWLMMTVVVAIAALISRRRGERR